MGQTLSEPIRDKSTTQGNDKRLLYAASSMQGWRTHMEDAHTTILDYGDTGASFFAVFDGHGGDAVAKYSGKELYKTILSSPSFSKGRPRDAIRNGYFGIDEALRNDHSFDNDNSGCTAVVTLLTKDNVLYVSNAGDSRAVISTRGGRGIGLTEDHKPRHPKEEQRIRNAGGYVENGRVNGSLALSRALGDFAFKNQAHLGPEQQAVTANPDIIEHLLTDQDEFVVLACDGIWDCMNNQQVVDFIRYKLCHHKTLDEICEELMDYCLADKGNMAGIGCDNMTVIIVAFLRKRRTVKQWYDWMASQDCPELPPRKPILISADIKDALPSNDKPPDDTTLAVKEKGESTTTTATDKETENTEKGAITVEPVAAEPLPIEQK